ncbi:Ankyrin repeat protein 1 [Giardia muris]|uniref:Ankyrin repeat protein 1 n=1 Tax=Giardia muris TaxID=5742 RepID=A0A4Z1T3F5_GIAMU|nr:Ankyrin repeat protein 1 [Giardia muris]|eukprot:TNJ27587.1 Ankyrin repeat protein 1 [Giardia muris]
MSRELRRAIEKRDLRAVKYGLENAGHVNDEGMTALMLAAREGFTEAVEVLLEREQGMKDGCDWTALMFAAQRGHKACLMLLRPYEEEICTPLKFTAFSAAWEAYQVRVLPYLLRAMRVGKLKPTALMETIIQSQEKERDATAEELEARYSGLLGTQKTVVRRMTALMLAAGYDHVGWVALLAPGTKDIIPMNMTALDIALMHRSYRAARILVDHGCKINDQGFTELMRAALRGDVAQARLHVREARQTCYGTFALMMATCLEHAEVMALLRDEREMRTVPEDESPLDCASLKTMQYLDEGIAQVLDTEERTPLYQAVEHGDPIRVLKNLSYAGLQCTSARQTALMLAVKLDNVDFVETLAPSETGLRDVQQQTALMHAAMHGLRDCVVILKNFEAGMRDKDGYTALMHAAVNGHVDCVQELAEVEMHLRVDEGGSIQRWLGSKIDECRSERVKSGMRQALRVLEKTVPTPCTERHSAGRGRRNAPRR